ncbi:hypothetical protein [Psychrobacillus lasiicapitis]|nr:hypothetical protein [Psychrobacillus lasiicapitis]
MAPFTFVTGIVDILQDPKATLDATVEAVTNPIETFNSIAEYKE